MGWWGYEPKHGDSPLDVYGTFENAIADAFLSIYGLEPSPSVFRFKGMKKAQRARYDAEHRKHMKKRMAIGDAIAGRICFSKKPKSRWDDPWNRWSIAGAVQEALEKGVALDRRVVERALADIKSCVSELEGWRDEKKFKRTAAVVIKRFEALLAAERGSHIYPPRGWPKVKPKRIVAVEP